MADTITTPATGGIWAILKKIWFWTKKIGWLILVIIGIIMVIISSKGKNRKIRDIDDKLAEVNARENKTQEDLRKIRDLEKEREEVENEIISITEKYKEKVDKLKEKPDKPEPGDPGRSKDDLDKVW